MKLKNLTDFIYKFPFLLWITGLFTMHSFGYQEIVKKTDTLFKTEVLLVHDWQKLQEVKRRVSNIPSLPQTLTNLYKTADNVLKEEVLSVTHKTQLPPSGSAHDYLSLAPYWWPDPKKTDGLPWIWRDGEINPLTQGNKVDQPVKTRFFKNIDILSRAYFFSEETKYAEKALQLLEAWFINPSTRMNPNLNYAQGIPGRNTGRGIGIIEFAGIRNILKCLEILKKFKKISKNNITSINSWLENYLTWLQTSEFGIFEKNKENNHGTWYDVQEVSLLLYLQKYDNAKTVLKSVKENRITKQIETDGSQPHELKRTKSLSYSTMNLKALTILAVYGKKLNVNLFDFTTTDNRSIQNAYHFLYPYALKQKEWKYQQINGQTLAHQQLQRLVIQAGYLFEISTFKKVGAPNWIDLYY